MNIKLIPYHIVFARNIFDYIFGSVFAFAYSNKQDWITGMIMLMRNQKLKRNQKAEEKKLVLGDYVTVNVPVVEESQINLGASHDDSMQFENLFQRIVKQRGVLHTVQKITDSVIDVGNRRRKILQNSEPQNSELQHSA